MPGEVVHVHGKKGNKGRLHSFGWGGFVHRVYGDGYIVSQRDPSCHSSQFYFDREEIYPGIWTFEGFICLRCKQEIR